MSNFLLRNPDCVLIHIPKTGGTTIRKGICGSNYEGPAFGEFPAPGGGCLSLHVSPIHFRDLYRPGECLQKEPRVIPNGACLRTPTRSPLNNS